MPSLLDIPPELRESIIRHVLYNHHTPPETPSKSNRVSLQDFQYNGYKMYHVKRRTRCFSSCTSLLLTNRQLFTETRSVINRMKSTTYILDISVLNEMNLFPTWISVPYITKRVSTLHVDVRLFGHIMSKEVARRQVGDGGIVGFHWSFYGLLQRFLRYGPVDERKKSSKPPFESDDYDVTVKLLVLNFKSAELEPAFPPDTVTYDTWESWHFMHFYSRQRDIDLERYTTRPEWVSKFLVSEIRSLLRMNYYTASYGKILYERIGAIRILVDGDLKHEFDLASILASLRFTRPQETFGHFVSQKRISAFWNWKKETLTRREQLGFPVVWPKDPELARECNYPRH
jgi:hypothetical protein